MNLTRVHKLQAGTLGTGPILYWMNRECRVQQNWSMIFAQELAKTQDVPLIVAYNLDPQFRGGSRRQLRFKLEGLQDVAQACAELHIPFFIIDGTDTAGALRSFLKTHSIGGLVTDFSPIRTQQTWNQEVLQVLAIPFFEVDSHNIVPCRVASQKAEFGAYTIRPKIHRLLPTYLTAYPEVTEQDIPHNIHAPAIDWDALLQQGDTTIPDIAPEHRIRGGSLAAEQLLHTFLTTLLPGYAERRNDPTLGHISRFSAYLHYGHISAQHIARTVRQADAPDADKDAFLEELIVRKELADNYCFYQPYYDSFGGFHPWAQTTLNEHRADPRTHLYTEEQFEHGRTHDPLWNAAQRQMVQTGYMHGYMRMYWAKKILEWTPSPEIAQHIAITLNDRYQLDGRDPNGYTGIAWSIGGVHDRAWGERPVFGKIRYMNAAGCKRKFDVDAYITWAEAL